MRPLSVVACVLCAIAALGLAFATYVDLSMFGFPDGHVTDFENAAEAPLTILAWLEAAFGPLFLVLAVSPLGSRARVIGMLLAVAGLALMAVVARIGVPWYFGTHLGLDNGIGG